MDEYYCPNCGATLNDQYGFDPELGHFTCEVCGTELYGESVEETMGRFDGVVWYCDNCGACLNMQDGFSDYGDYWYCSECGHKNPINENEIYESREDYESSSYWRDDYSDEESDDSYETSEESSYDSDEEYDSNEYDDRDEYNSDEDYDFESNEEPQEGCFTAPIGGSKIPKEMPEFPFGWKTVHNTHNNTQNNTQYNTQNNTHIHETPKNKYDVEIEKIRERKAAKQIKTALIILAILSVIAVVCTVAGMIWEGRIESAREDNYQSFVAEVQKNIDDGDFSAAEQLVNRANPDDSWPEDKIDTWAAEKENYLVEIEEKRAQSTGIPIQTIAVPRSAKDYKRENYIDVISEFKDAGFIRVHYIKAGDKANVIHRANTVQRVSIDGETEFDEGDQYSKVAKIVVYYYGYN